MVRLPSLRPPRDLTLAGGGSNGPTFGPVRSKFTPNLTLAGKRQTPQTSDGHQNSDHRGGGGGNRGRGGRGRGGAGRGRGKFEPEIIQSKGIFSDGFSETATKNSSFSRDAEASGGSGFSGGGGGGGRSGIVSGRRGQENASSETINQAGVKYEPMETDEVALSSLFKDNVCSSIFSLLFYFGSFLYVSVYFRLERRQRSSYPVTFFGFKDRTDPKD